jgi:hypothetical protein
MSSSLAGSDSNGYFSCGNTWRCTSQDCRRSHGKTLSSCDNCRGEFERMPCSARLPWNAWRLLRTYTVTTKSPDCLRRLTVTRILKTKPHRTYSVQYFCLRFLKQGITLRGTCAWISFHTASVRVDRSTYCIGYWPDFLHSSDTGGKMGVQWDRISAV